MLTDIHIFLFEKIYIYYLTGYPVSGKIIGRISGHFCIRYNPNKVLHLFLT